MNPQRLVAAGAALAIGFGVTLVGVGFADEDMAASTVEPAANVADDPAGSRPPTEQEEETAEEPIAAEVDEPATSPAERPTQEGEVQEGTPRQPGSGSSPAPSPLSSCEPAVVVTGVDRRVLVLTEDDVRFVGNQSGDVVAVLRVSEQPIDAYVDLVADSEIVEGSFADTDDGTPFVDCATGDPVIERDPDSLRDDLLDADAPSGAVSLDLPCDSRFIDEFATDVGRSDEIDAARDDGATDHEIVSFYVAERLAEESADGGRPQEDFEFWDDTLVDSFVGFRTDDNVDEACEQLDRSVDLGAATRSDFYCGVGRLASDEQLLDLFTDLALLESTCRYPPAVRTGAAGGSGIENDDELEN